MTAQIRTPAATDAVRAMADRGTSSWGVLRLHAAPG
jgi:hypothetical protein